MRVGVVGAGIAGLAAARELEAAGCEVVVVEKSRGLGGRVAARRVEGTVVDHGLPALEVPPGSALGELAAGIAEDRVEVDRPVLGPDGAAQPGAGPRLAWRAGMTRLPKAMAEGLDVRLGTRVAALRAGRDGIELGQDQGNTIAVVDAVVVSAPAPQAAELLATAPDGQRAAAALGGVVYHPAVVVLAGVPMPGGAPPWFARRLGDGLLMWVDVETAKGRPAVDGALPVVARLSPPASARLIDVSDDLVLDEALPALAAVLGDGAGDPAWAQVKRWRYAVPRDRLDQAALNPPGSRVVVCGDAVAAAGGIAEVHATGVRAARALLDAR